MIVLPCLSYRQPHVWAMLAAGKCVENRSRRYKYRGPMLMHASAGCTRDEYEEAMFRWLDLDLLAPGVQVPRYDQLHRGGIVGACFFTGDHIPPTDRKTPWHMRKQWGHCITTAIELPFRPYKGQQTFGFKVEVTPTEARILRQAKLIK